jgi:hypothetical protein
MQPLMYQDFTYNSLVCDDLRGNPPIILKINILHIGGGTSRVVYCSEAGFWAIRSAKRGSVRRLANSESV